MPRRKATTNDSEKTTVQKKPEQIVETQAEETPPSETSEMEDSTVETVRFIYKGILDALVLILIALFIIYFGKIKDFFYEDVSRIYVIGGVIVALIVGLLGWYVPKRQVRKLAKQSSEEKLTDFEREEKRLKLEDDTRKTRIH